MEGKRITVSPRPCSGRRILARKRTRIDGFVNSVKKLQRREICSKRDRAFSMSNAQERFRNIGLQILRAVLEEGDLDMEEIKVIVAEHLHVRKFALQGIPFYINRLASARLRILFGPCFRLSFIFIFSHRNYLPGGLTHDCIQTFNDVPVLVEKCFGHESTVVRQSLELCPVVVLAHVCLRQVLGGLDAFHHYRFLKEEYDTHDPKGHCPLVLPFLKKRSKIIEIVAARDIVFALAQSGVCAAFSRETNQRICFLNVSPDEVIRSLFYNKNNDSLITVSVYASDNFSSLKCRTTRIEYIRRGKPDAGFALFESESLKWPGFVEFDDVNGKVLTYSAQDSIYKVFDLKNYTLLYSISDKNVQEIKISPGIMLLIFTRAGSHVPLKILSIEDGTVLKDFKHLLHRNKKVDFIEQFNEKLLVKQENENLQILDVRNAELTQVNKTQFMTPSAFIFLYENQLFLTFRNRTVAVWNFRGELVTSFEDHLLWHPDCNTNNIYITSDQDLIISYCKADSDDPLEGNAGSINVSNILTGKCLAKIRASNSNPEEECSSSGGRSRLKKRTYSSRIRSSVAEALEDITALFYDEERNEIYTGNRQGLVHVWSN